MAQFPYLPLAAIVSSLVSQQIVLMSVFAYAPFMVEHLGVVDDSDEAGFYAGLLSSAFMTGRLFSSHLWGLIADGYGRRFVIVVALGSTGVLSIAFGFSTSYKSAYIFRFLLGLFNGTIVASKALVSEVCAKEHQATGMGFVMAGWALGAILGPGVGGMLSEPAIHHPQTFSSDGLFGRYPYLLPNVVAAGLAFLVLPLVMVFIKHTPKTGSSSDNNTNKQEDVHNDDTFNTDHSQPPTEAESAQQLEDFGVRKPSWMQPETIPPVAVGNASHQVSQKLGGNTRGSKPDSLLARKDVRALLFMDVVYSFAFSGFDEVYSLWTLTTLAKGGLDWSTLQIGQAYFACGLMVMVFEFFAVPNLTPRLGIRTSQRVGAAILVPLYALLPTISSGLEGAELTVTISATVFLFTGYVCSHAFYVGLSLAINKAAGPDRRGELNGISMTLSSIARTVSPIACSALYAYTINSDQSFPFDYHLVFYLLALVRLAVAYMAWNRIEDVESVEISALPLTE